MYAYMLKGHGHNVSTYSCTCTCRSVNARGVVNFASTVCTYMYMYQGAVTPILAVGPSATGVKMRSRGQRVFGTPVKGSMTNFKVGQMVKTTLHITGSVNGQHHFPDVIDSYCLFLSPFLQLQIITPSPQHYEHDEACSNLCHNSNN